MDQLPTRRAAHLVAADGTRLYAQSWLPAASARAALVVIHGYGEHGGRYAPLAARLAPLGFAVHVADLRGHGQSPGRRGHVDRFEQYLQDVRALLRVAATGTAGTPLIVLGHSLGGLIAALLAEEGWGDDLDQVPSALVLSSPFLRLAAPPSGLKLAAARLLSRIAPSCDVGNTLDAADLSHDPAVLESYREDPLVHHVATARWAVETLAAQRRALDGAPRLTLPLLVVHGTADAIAEPAATRALFAAAGSADKTCLSYEGAYHELFNEVERDEVIADLAAWLERHIPAL